MKSYEAPQMGIRRFSFEDILTLSTDGSEDIWNDLNESEEGGADS